MKRVVLYIEGRQKKKGGGLPAKALIGSFLVDSHHIHELQTSTLMVGTQQNLAVGVDLLNMRKSLEEVVIEILIPKSIDLLI
jgi:hypothetical protein